MTKRGSIELARSQCEAIAGELPDGEQYGSVDVAEILSGHVETLESMCERLAKEMSYLLEALDESRSGFIPGCGEDLKWGARKDDSVKDARAALAEWEESK